MRSSCKGTSLDLPINCHGDYNPTDLQIDPSSIAVKYVLSQLCYFHN